MRRIALFVIAALALLEVSSGQERSAPDGNRGTQFQVDARVRQPEVLAVRVHHDMCPHCTRLKPQFEKLGARVIDASVLLVTLDLSTPATQQQAALMAGALGIEFIWTVDLSRVGTVTFLDFKSKKTLAEFRADGDRSLEAVAETATQRRHDKP